MNEEIRKVLQQSVRVLKAKGGLMDKETKLVIVGIEKIINQRRPVRRFKRA